jgi:hypothetical protein
MGRGIRPKPQQVLYREALSANQWSKGLSLVTCPKESTSRILLRLIRPIRLELTRQILLELTSLSLVFTLLTEANYQLEALMQKNIEQISKTHETNNFNDIFSSNFFIFLAVFFSF